MGVDVSSLRRWETCNQEGRVPELSGRVIADYQAAYPHPLTMHIGQELTLGKTDPQWPGWIWCTDANGTSAWVPQTYVQAHNTRVTALRNYTSKELCVHAGEWLTLYQSESGWFWATNAEGESGWVPATHVRTAEVAPNQKPGL